MTEVVRGENSKSEGSEVLFMFRLKNGESSEMTFAGKTYLFERVNPFFLKVTLEGKSRLVSIEKTAEIRIETLFYDNPYFFKWESPLQASPRTTLKFFLRLPLKQDLVVEAGKRDIVIDSFHEAGRKAWHGEVHKGLLCDYVRPDVYFEPVDSAFANMPVRVVNSNSLSTEIKNFVVDPRYLMLFKAENGYFTNKVYVNVLKEGGFSMSYGTVTTNAAKKPKKVVQEQAKSPKRILTRFSPLKLAREFGL